MEVADAGHEVTSNPLFNGLPSSAYPFTSMTPYGNATRNETFNYSDFSCMSLDIEGEARSYKVLIYSGLSFVVIGLVGNFFSICVFTSQEMRAISSNVYLLLLAISDSLYLVFFLLAKVFTGLSCLFLPSAFDISNHSHGSCKLLQYMMDLFSNYSTCLILAFTVERYIAVYMPIKYKQVCTVHRARVICCFIFSVVSVVIAPYHFISMGRYPEYNVCSVLKTRENLFVICYVIEVFLFRIIPVLIIAVLNGFIISKVSKVTKMRRKKKAGSRVAGGAGNVNKKSIRRHDKSLQLTIMLILVSVTYIISYIPTLIQFFLWKLTRANLIDVPKISMAVFKNYSQALHVSGFATNFFLYTMSGRVFREQLVAILCYSQPRRGSQNGHTTYTECNDKTSAL